ncbi:hypothetical protein [Pseudarthrobacter sp. efr-133-R2A-89]|uniref:hypothetical protein n=1 Tax=Pseudarthrobacter sp. efr-133-R2A-89 TaxID=3040302 RepID=UPI0025551A26|nr:hypothetical protein [Pseudarthrobacter sp. efr-133-R2A-89]
MTTTLLSAGRTLRLRAGVVLVLLAAVALAGCVPAAPTSTPPSASSPSAGSTVQTSEFSTLDAAGVDTIRETKTARLDMRSGRLQKASVRLTDDSFGPEINTRDLGKISLTIAGPTGDVQAETDRIRFSTTDQEPDFREVTYFLTAGSLEEYTGLIRDGVEKYGVDSAAAERWISSTERNPGTKSDFSITSGTSTGLEVNYDLRYDGSKDLQVIIVHINPLT